MLCSLLVLLFKVITPHLIKSLRSFMYLLYSFPRDFNNPLHGVSQSPPSHTFSRVSDVDSFGINTNISSLICSKRIFEILNIKINRRMMSNKKCLICNYIITYNLYLTLILLELQRQRIGLSTAVDLLLLKQTLFFPPNDQTPFAKTQSLFRCIRMQHELRVKYITKNQNSNTHFSIPRFPPDFSHLQHHLANPL